MTIRIAIAGAAGRMGQALIKCAAGGDFAVVGGSERAGSGAVGKELVPGVVISDAVNKAAATADVWLDFTTPEATLAALDQLRTTNVKAAIVGTTGLAPQHDPKIAEHAKRIAIVKTGNFSLGVNLMLGLIEQASQRLGAGWDIEISETHHKRKVDAPSGTALMMGESAARSRGQKLSDLRNPPYDGLTGPRKDDSIAFAVTRGGGVIGDHKIRFISDEEIVSIGHRALDRALFAKGALHAARWAAGQKPGLYNMRDVLAL
ncbi:MAG TPA: 4-hydroxy-tetrahydrodipicolinate reductase [Hyphomonadaceae bacterium]|nr:4-hydroxy-tetrahydrodipicolinate reductase [Hyphomonadaceae bacterium]